jgi:predicted HTH transcriptional regulator
VEATLVATVKQQGKISGQKLRKIAGTYVDSWRIDNLLNALVEQGRLKKLKGETGTEKFLPGPEAKDG